VGPASWSSLIRERLEFVGVGSGYVADAGRAVDRDVHRNRRELIEEAETGDGLDEIALFVVHEDGAARSAYGRVLLGDQDQVVDRIGRSRGALRERTALSGNLHHEPFAGRVIVELDVHVAERRRTEHAGGRVDGHAVEKALTQTVEMA